MSQVRRYSSVLIRVMSATALLCVAANVCAQTLAGGTNHSVILKSDGTVWTVGHNGVGQLGDGTTTARTSVVQVSGLSDVVAVASGANHALALTSTGNLYLWGYNTNGQIGDGTTTTRSTAVQSSLANVTAIAAGVELIRSRGRFSYATCDTVRRSYSAGLI